MAGINIDRQVNPRIGTGGAGPQAPSRITETTPNLEQIAKQRPAGPQYFGYHTDSSIAARLAQQGIPPNQVSLRVATQMLRYGVPINAEALNQFRQLWQGMGSAALVDLEALMALFTSGLEIDPRNMKAMTQLLSGGPTSHLLAQLTMALRNAESGNPQLQDIKNTLNTFWKLGAGSEQLGAELPQFQQALKRIERGVMGMEPAKVPPELSSELGQLKDLLHAQEMLVQQRGSAIYVPFYQWRDQQPMPGELLVQTDESASAQAAGYAQVTLAIDTRNLGRLTIDFTTIRGHLAVKIETQDLATKQFLERGLPDLRHRLTFRTPYQVATIQAQETGQGRAISVLLPKRRDPRKLGRAIGVI